jgi:hypothetical protein
LRIEGIEYGYVAVFAFVPTVAGRCPDGAGHEMINGKAGSDDQGVQNVAFRVGRAQFLLAIRSDFVTTKSYCEPGQATIGAPVKVWLKKEL